MKIKLLLNSKIAAATLTFATIFGGTNLFAQTVQVRSYATRQGAALAGIDILGSTANLSNAVDVNPYTSGNLTVGIGVGATRTLFLDFNPSPSSTTSYATTIPANTPITVKFNIPAGLVSALNNFQIAAITNLHQTGLGAWTATDVGPTYSGSSLVGLLAGSGSIEYTITPTAAFQGIRVAITGLASVAAGIDVYDAYIRVPAANTDCSQIIDELAGVRAGSVSLANATGSVTNQYNAIDNSLSTYSTVSTGVQGLSQVYQTAVFNTPSKLGDSVQLTIQDVSSNVLNLGVLTGLKINLYNGSSSTPVQTVANDSTSILNLNLFNPIGNIYTLTFAPNAVFDRVELQLGGAVGAFQSLRVYEMERKNAGVALTASQKDIYAYAGNNFILNGSSVAPGDVVNYYNSSAGGTPMGSNSVPTSLSQSTTLTAYYTGATRVGCTEVSDLNQINAHIIGHTKVVPTDGLVGTPYTSSIAVTPAAGSVLPLTPSLRYRTSSAMPPGLALDTTSGAITGTPTTANSYPLTTNVVDVANNLNVGTFADNIAISSVPLATTLAGFSAQLLGSNVSLNWQMAQTLNVKGYVVERSLDGKTFVSIGSVSNATYVNNYSFIDRNVAAGVNYYRIKVMLDNGGYDYSKIINIELNAKATVAIYPNPVTDGKLFVKGDNIQSITLASSIGQTMAVPVVQGADVQEVTTGSLAKGIYFISVRQQDGTTTSYRFIIK